MMTRMLFSTLLLLVLLAFPAVAQESPLNLDGAAAVLETPTPPPTPVAAPETSSPIASTPNESVTSPSLVKKESASFWSLLRASGSVGFVICLLSLAAVALVIEHTLTIRRGVVIPVGLPDELLGLLNAGQWAQARQRGLESESMLGIAVANGVTECELGWTAVEEAAEQAIAERSAKLYRKVEYLNLIGNIAPMLGLLGTVVGMVVAFQEMADTQGAARAADLAKGIYLALVTTVEGLVVAIPTLALYAIFTNRIATLAEETAFLAGQILLPVKKRLTGRVDRVSQPASPSQQPVRQG